MTWLPKWTVHFCVYDACVLSPAADAELYIVWTLEFERISESGLKCDYTSNSLGASGRIYIFQSSSETPPLSYAASKLVTWCRVLVTSRECTLSYLATNLAAVAYAVAPSAAPTPIAAVPNLAILWSFGFSERMGWQRKERDHWKWENSRCYPAGWVEYHAMHGYVWMSWK